MQEEIFCIQSNETLLTIWNSSVIKELVHAFSYVYIVEVWMHAEVWGTLKKLELLSDVAASNTYAPSQTSREHTRVNHEWTNS